MKKLILLLGLSVLTGCAVDPNGTSAFSIGGSGFTAHQVPHVGYSNVYQNISELNTQTKLPASATSVNKVNDGFDLK